jgi:diaminohydroxyphosphoribosylaminopyrimidine deaminase / 5-amino-6-(5-phosphoribosylamino)uracil reductase
MFAPALNSINAPLALTGQPIGPLSDEQAMDWALVCASQALWLSNPNPRVGCVLTDDKRTIIATGFTQAAGQAHAEIMALRDAAGRGLDLSAATAYVTLEPCAHHGRTPPCCDALIASGIKRVVIGALDPNPLVAGQGMARMQAAGIEVVHGVRAQASQWLNIGFFSRMLRNRPWVRLKMAASSDGVTALPNGQSQWITSDQARADGHAFRARACAVLTGAGTVLSDDPQLTVRNLAVQRQPHVVVVDSRLQTPLQAKLLQPSQPERQVWLYHSGQASTEQQAALTNAGAQLRSLPSAAGKVDLPAMLADLSERGVNELHIEAGAALNGSWLREGLVDELLLYIAPSLLGQGAGLSTFGPLCDLNQGIAMDFAAPTLVGPDLRLQATMRVAHAWLQQHLAQHVTTD